MGPIAKKESQYFVIAAAAYKLIIAHGMNIEEAWKKSPQDNAGSDSTRDKPCPKQTFLDLCYSGDLIGRCGVKSIFNFPMVLKITTASCMS